MERDISNGKYFVLRLYVLISNLMHTKGWAGVRGTLPKLKFVSLDRKIRRERKKKERQKGRKMEERT